MIRCTKWSHKRHITVNLPKPKETDGTIGYVILQRPVPKTHKSNRKRIVFTEEEFWELVRKLEPLRRAGTVTL